MAWSCELRSPSVETSPNANDNGTASVFQPNRSANSRSTQWLMVALTAILALCPSLAQAQDTPREASRDAEFENLANEIASLERQGHLLRRVVRLIKPSVVHIEAASRNRSVEEAGGGVIMKMDGKYFVLTNRHVVKDSDLKSIKIKLDDGRRLHPVKSWDDPGTDIAILQINADKLLAARLGDSDKAEIGDFVLAVGSPFGLSHSVTFGIISAKGRRDLQLGDDRVRFQDFIQTDAAINPGNSGGPLANLHGQIIGINTAIASNSGGNEGIGFTIPINMVKLIAKQLISSGRVSRAYLGVHLSRDFDPSRSAAQLGLPRPAGALVSGITPNSPAQQADLQTSDVIIRVNGKWVDDDDHLINEVSLMPVGRRIELGVIRDGKVLEVQVKVGDRGDFEPETP